MTDFLAATIRIATPLLFAAFGRGPFRARWGVCRWPGRHDVGWGICGDHRALDQRQRCDRRPICNSWRLGNRLDRGYGRRALPRRSYGNRADGEYFGSGTNQLSAPRRWWRPVAVHLDPLAAWRIPGLADIPVLGPLLFEQPPLTYLAVLGCLLIALFLRYTQAGLILRATGENPEAVFASGGEPLRVRMIAVIAGAGIAGLGGAVLSLQQVGTFTDGMTGGRGYLALASLIVGRSKSLGGGRSVSGIWCRRGIRIAVAELRRAGRLPISCKWRRI